MKKVWKLETINSSKKPQSAQTQLARSGRLLGERAAVAEQELAVAGSGVGNGSASEHGVQGSESGEVVLLGMCCY